METFMQTPWIDALTLPTCDEKLTQMIRIAPMGGAAFHRESADVAAGLLLDAMSKTYHPGAQHLSIVRKIVGTARIHACKHYASPQQFVSQAMGSLKLPPDPAVVMVTGHPGVGKSALMRSVARLISTDQSAQPSKSLPPFPIHPMVSLEIRSFVRRGELLSELVRKIGLDEDYKSAGGKDARHAQLALYQRGCSAILPDELQFLSRSKDANAQVSMVLTQLADLGIPVIFSCNFSLGHKLKKRPPEEAVRLLSSPIVLLPDEPDEPAYLGFLQDMATVFDGMLSIRASEHAHDIHDMTFGLKRPAIRLLTFAYRIARGSAGKSRAGLKVTIDHLRQASKSIDYEVDRKAVEQCNRALLGLSGVDTDYKCPFELPPTTAQKMSAQADELRQRTLAHAELVSGSRAPPKTSPPAPIAGASKHKVVPISAVPKLRAPKTAADFLEGLDRRR